MGVDGKGGGYLILGDLTLPGLIELRDYPHHPQ